MPLCVAAIQLPATFAKTDDRWSEIDSCLEAASAQEARLAVLPELALTGFEVNERAATRAEPVPGPGTSALVSLARKHDLMIAAGISERCGSDCFDTFAVVGPDGYLGKYRKIHVSVVENACWKCGLQGAVVATDLGRVGLGVCADMTYRTPWASYKEQGVDLIAAGSAWPDWRSQRFFPLSKSYRETAWRAVVSLPEQISRAVGAPMVHANCCGVFSTRQEFFGAPLRFAHAGRSSVSDGVTLAVADQAAREAVIVSHVEPGARPPDQSAWAGPWIPGSSPWVRCQVYGTDLLLNSIFKSVYRISASRRRKLLSGADR